MGSDPPKPDPSIARDMAQLRTEAEADKTSAIQDGLTRETRQLLLRFGRMKAFSGASMGGLNISGAGDLGMPQDSFGAFRGL